MRAEGTDMCNSYATWMRLDGNRNIQCKPNFFLPSQLERATHSMAGTFTTTACLPIYECTAFMAIERSRTLYERGIGCNAQH